MMDTAPTECPIFLFACPKRKTGRKKKKDTPTGMRNSLLSLCPRTWSDVTVSPSDSGD